ncbi:MAG: twin-arginine translocase subunit TatC [Gammaproteobacteria bacterium]|nr:twin-arginine translocase subunit TatC [Gammaproteobacteria bacterium]
MAQQPDHSVETEQPFISHLLELRDRLIRVVAGVLVVFLVLFPFANDLFTALADPLTAVLPEGSSLIATEVASPFLTPFKLALMLAIYLAMPWILYQAWGFVAPGLYKHEKRLIAPLLISSSLLYYAGMAFAYYVVFPLVFAFMAATTPEGVQMATDIGKYLDFVLALFFAFGVAFEVPVAVILLVWTGMVDQEALRAKRPYIIVGAFVIGMFLTPPDVISQTLLALPMWLLFEVGVLASGWFQKQSIAGARERERIDEAEREAMDREAAEDDYRPRSAAEMEAELERMEKEEEAEAEQREANARPPARKHDDLASKTLDELREMARRGELKEPPISERGFTQEGLEEELAIQGSMGDWGKPPAAPEQADKSGPDADTGAFDEAGNDVAKPDVAKRDDATPDDHDPATPKPDR